MLIIANAPALAAATVLQSAVRTPAAPATAGRAPRATPGVRSEDERHEIAMSAGSDLDAEAGLYDPSMAGRREPAVPHR